jgi:hypothetical protein
MAYGKRRLGHKISLSKLSLCRHSTDHYLGNASTLWQPNSSCLISMFKLIRSMTRLHCRPFHRVRSLFLYFKPSVSLRRVSLRFSVFSSTMKHLRLVSVPCSRERVWAQTASLENSINMGRAYCWNYSVRHSTRIYPENAQLSVGMNGWARWLPYLPNSSQRSKSRSFGR